MSVLEQYKNALIIIVIVMVFGIAPLVGVVSVILDIIKSKRIGKLTDSKQHQQRDH